MSRGELLLTDLGAEPEDSVAVWLLIALIRLFWRYSTTDYASIAGQMGVTLRNTASSVNVKERLDFSCAIFTADGRLVANAPHVPVHLGAMEETVRSIIAANPGFASRAMFSQRMIRTRAVRICRTLLWLHQCSCTRSPSPNPSPVSGEGTEQMNCGSLQQVGPITRRLAG